MRLVETRAEPFAAADEEGTTANQKGSALISDTGGPGIHAENFFAPRAEHAPAARRKNHAGITSRVPLITEPLQHATERRERLRERKKKRQWRVRGKERPLGGRWDRRSVP